MQRPGFQVSIRFFAIQGLGGLGDLHFRFKSLGVLRDLGFKVSLSQADYIRNHMFAKQCRAKFSAELLLKGVTPTDVSEAPPLDLEISVTSPPLDIT